MIMRYSSAAFDKSLPWQERTSKMLTLGTMVAAIAAFMKKREEDRETPEGSEKTPYQLRPGSRILIGHDAQGREIYVRITKYPWFNLTSLGLNLAKGQNQEAIDLLRDQFGTVGPGADLAMLALGYKSEFEQYKSTDAILGEHAATYIPGFRILNDVGRMMDPYSRKSDNFVQGLFANLPIWGSETTRAKLRGDRRTIKIPDEPARS